MLALIEKKIQMIDYETLTDKNNNRIIGFGRYAGVVGAYNGILGYGLKYDLFRLKPANLCRDGYRRLRWRREEGRRWPRALEYQRANRRRVREAGPGREEAPDLDIGVQPGLHSAKELEDGRIPEDDRRVALLGAYGARGETGEPYGRRAVSRDWLDDPAGGRCSTSRARPAECRP